MQIHIFCIFIQIIFQFFLVGIEIKYTVRAVKSVSELPRAWNLRSNVGKIQICILLLDSKKMYIPRSNP
jgi:hypothetical protein